LLDEQKTAFESVARGEDKEAVALLYGKVYEQELERVQERIDHFRQMLDNRARDAIIDATNASRTLRTLSEVMVGLTALLFLFVMGFILKRRVLRPVVRLSDVVHRLASQDYAVETPNFNQIDEIGDMAQAIRIFRENGLARQQLERERDANWAIRELLARMTQRLQGCENFADVINVAELFAPNIAPALPGGSIFLIENPGRCAALPSGFHRKAVMSHSIRTNAGRCGVDRAIPRSTVSRISSVITCQSRVRKIPCAYRSLLRARPSVCCHSRISTKKLLLFAAIWS
jgi:HAMP domain-containing protein